MVANIQDIRLWTDNPMIVMEKHIGRYLKPDEVVHHINRNKRDNSIQNLLLMTKSTHRSLHGRENPVPKQHLDKLPEIKKLKAQGVSNRKIAQQLQLHRNTINTYVNTFLK